MTARAAELVAAMKDFQLDVRPYPWDDRPWSAFTTAGGWDPQGVLHHHTGGSTALLAKGMNDSKKAMLRLLRIGRGGANPLDGPLCHVAPTFMQTGQHVVYLIGVGNVNHAGLGGRNVATAIKAGTYGGASSDGDKVDGNAMLYGLEYLHPGTSAPWPDELLEAGHRAAAAFCQAEGWTPSHWAGSNAEHREWTHRKVDRSWSGHGDVMRQRIAALSREQVEQDDGWFRTEPIRDSIALLRKQAAAFQSRGLIRRAATLRREANHLADAFPDLTAGD